MFSENKNPFLKVVMTIAAVGAAFFAQRYAAQEMTKAAADAAKNNAKYYPSYRAYTPPPRIDGHGQTPPPGGATLAPAPSQWNHSRGSSGGAISFGDGSK